MSELTTLHDAIAKVLKDQMPKVVQVEAYPELEPSFRLPAIFFALTDITLGGARGEGKTGILGRFQALILVDATREKSGLQAAILATQLTAVLDSQYWGVDFVLGPPESIHAEPGGGAPELAQFAVWAVEWTQQFEVGELEWPWDDEPGPIVFGFYPDTGPGHVDDYVEPGSLGGAL